MAFQRTAPPQAGPPVKTEGDGSKGAPILKAEAEIEKKATVYSFRNLKKPGQGDYQEVAKKFGHFAATDLERKSKTIHDSRFEMSPLLREPLSIEDEERKVISERVKKEVALLTEASRQEGFQQGLSEGRKEGSEKATAEMRQQASEILARLNSLVDSFEGAKQRIYEENEAFILETMAHLCRRVVLRELTGDKEYLPRIAKELIEKTGVRENLTLRIHPEDYKLVEQLQVGLQKTFGALKNLTIESSDEVGQGGCIFESEWNAINATLESQLAHLESALTAKPI